MDTTTDITKYVLVSGYTASAKIHYSPDGETPSCGAKIRYEVYACLNTGSEYVVTCKRCIKIGDRVLHPEPQPETPAAPAAPAAVGRPADPRTDRAAQILAGVFAPAAPPRRRAAKPRRAATIDDLTDGAKFYVGNGRIRYTYTRHYQDGAIVDVEVVDAHANTRYVRLHNLTVVDR